MHASRLSSLRWCTCLLTISLLVAGCASTGNTLSQDVVYAAWDACKREGRIDVNITLDRVEPSGRYWLRILGGQTGRQGAFDCVEEKTRNAAGLAPAPSQMVVAPPALPAPVGQVVASRDVVTPTWQIGDEWAYRYEQPSGSGTYVWSVDRIEPLGSERHYVIKTGTREIFYRVSDLAFTEEHLNGRIVRQITPSDWRSVAFPLFVGKSWDMKYHETRPLEHQTEDIERTCKAEAEESVSVPAGTFQTIRTVCTNKRNNAWVATVWYSPEVRQAVRLEFAVTGGRQTRELLAYRVR